jgi:perosamine synthetase
MLDSKIRKKVISKGKPQPSDIPWYGEPNLGSIYGEDEIEAVVEVLRKSSHWSVGFGPNPEEIDAFENTFAAYCGANYAIAVSNNGVGFDMVLKAMEIEPGDEIITPALNFKAWHMAMIRHGCKVVFCDINQHSLNIDPVDVEKRITPKTRVICPVHLAGVPCQMDKLESLSIKYQSKKHGPIKVIDDAARAAGVNYEHGKVGSKGWASIFSFHSAKLMSTLGEGGMVTTNDSKLAAKLKGMRNYGGENGWGLNYRMSKVQAFVGIVQLKKLDLMNEMRKRVAMRRTEYLSGMNAIVLPEKMNYPDHVYYLYPVIFKPDWAGERRDRFLKILEKEYGVFCSIPKVLYKRWPYIASMCGSPKMRISEDIGERIFCLPMHPDLTEEQELYISSAVIEAINNISND